MFFLLTVVLASPFARMDVSPFDAGFFFKLAKDFAEGKTLYGEVFTFYGMLTTVLQGTVLKLFGYYYVVNEYLTVFFYGLIAALLWLVWFRCLPGWLTVAACGIWLLLAPYFPGTMLPWPSVFALFFQVLALYFYVRATESDRGAPWLLSAGVSIALAVWCRQAVGILELPVFVFLLMYPILHERRALRTVAMEIAWLMLGVLIGMGVFLIWLAADGVVRDWYRQTFVFAKLFVNNWGTAQTLPQLIAHLFPFRPLGYYRTEGSFIYGVLPVCNLLVFGLGSWKVLMRRAFAHHEMVAYAVAATSIAAWAQYYPFPDDNHAYWAATTMVGMLCYVVWRAMAYLWDVGFVQTRLIYGEVIIIVLLALVGRSVAANVSVGMKRLERRDDVVIAYPKVLAGIRTAPSQAKLYGSIAQIIDRYTEEYPGTKVINAHKYGLFITFTDQATTFSPLWLHYYMPWALQIFPNYFDQLRSFARANQPLVIANEDIHLDGYSELARFMVPEPLKLLVPTSQLPVWAESRGS